ncbi:MAG: YeeE/YedE thiosulfate transporter family protein [Bacillota bacterium]
MESKSRLLKGLLTGVIFGFLLQRGGVTQFNVLVGQLMLDDYTVAKIIITAIITGMIGVYFLSDLKLIKLKPKSGSLRRAIPGGLIFGAGFAFLGYCPGTIAGAIGQGSVDALVAGLTGIVTGSFLFAAFYERFGEQLEKNKFKEDTIPEYFQINQWYVIIGAVIILIGLLVWIEI